MPRKAALTPEQVRERFRLHGITLTEWAAEKGFNRQAVYRVMAGQDKAHYGRAHEIAVALGLKVPDAQPSTALGNRNTQSRAAA
jgi:gp16 family phage-associated protein